MPFLTPKGAEAAAIAAIEKLTKSPEAAASPSALPPPPRLSKQLPQHVGGIPHSTSNTVSPPRTSSLLECDYDVNPTELYQAIEAKQWDYCRSFFRKTSAVVSRECQTWVVRKEPNGKLRWRLLPLHAAIIFQSPLDVIEKLVGEYPTAAQCKDDQGMLPLHLAFRNETSWSVLEELLTAHPNAIFVKDRKGRTPLQCCPSGSHHSMSKSASGDSLNNCNSKAAGVLDLYSQIAVSSERQRALAESRAVLEARVGALQESHAGTLTSLRDDWEQQSKALNAELTRKSEELIIAQLEAQEAKAMLAQKNTTQVELTEKLQQVTLALNVAHEKRSQLEAAERIKWQQRRSIWQESHQEMFVLIQSLLEQQGQLLAQLHDADVKRQSVEVEWQKGLVETLQQLEQKLVVAPRERSTILKKSLQEQNKHATDRLAAVLAKTRSLWVNEGIVATPTTSSLDAKALNGAASTAIKPSVLTSSATAASATTSTIVPRTWSTTASSGATPNSFVKNGDGKTTLSALALNANASGMVSSSAPTPTTDLTTSTAVTSRRQLQPMEEEKKEKEADPPPSASSNGRNLVVNNSSSTSKPKVHSFYHPSAADSMLDP
jgi:hypothetical protein